MCERINSYHVRGPQEKRCLWQKPDFSWSKKVKRLFRQEAGEIGEFAEHGAHGGHGGKFGQVRTGDLSKKY